MNAKPRWRQDVTDLEDAQDITYFVGTILEHRRAIAWTATELEDLSEVLRFAGKALVRKYEGNKTAEAVALGMAKDAIERFYDRRR